MSEFLTGSVFRQVGTVWLTGLSEFESVMSLKPMFIQTSNNGSNESSMSISPHTTINEETNSDYFR